MGDWSRPVGSVFLDWLAAPSGLKWIDVGCGNGAFTELLVERCAPTLVHGIDPSEAQIDFARKRPAARRAKFDRGDAMALPFPVDAFDVAIMALVIFFVPDPAKGVAEMTRVVRPGGMVAAYAWDMLGGGFPLEPIRIEMRAMGLTVLSPPSSEASKIEVLRDLWTRAGLDAVETRDVTVQRTFPDFEDFWTISLSAPAVRYRRDGSQRYRIAESACACALARGCNGAHHLLRTRKRSEGPCAELAECPLWVVGSIGRCNTSIKSRWARVSKPKVSRDRSLSCRATRLNCECAPPAVPQLLLGHRVETSNISSTHRPSTPSLASEIKCCVDRLRPPS
jgi:SAM-dependent methyltransferase